MPTVGQISDSYPLSTQFLEKGAGMKWGGGIAKPS